MLVPGRIVFATALAGFGVLCFAYVDFVAQLQPVPSWVPGSGFLAVLTGILLVAASLAIMANVQAGPAAFTLAGFFAAWVVFLQVPSAFTNPELLRSPWWVRTFETVALAGAALVLAGLASSPPRERSMRTGRILFGVSLPVFGVLHLIYAEGTATLVPPWYPWPLFWAVFTGLGHITGGLAIVAGELLLPELGSGPSGNARERSPLRGLRDVALRLPRLAAILVGAMFAVFALTLHIPSQFVYDNARNEQTSLFVAVAMCGAAWIVAGSLAARARIPAEEKRQVASIGPTDQ